MNQVEREVLLTVARSIVAGGLIGKGPGWARRAVLDGQ
jgi:hypothetical protein